MKNKFGTKLVLRHWILAAVSSKVLRLVQPRDLTGRPGLMSGALGVRFLWTRAIASSYPTIRRSFPRVRTKLFFLRKKREHQAEYTIHRRPLTSPIKVIKQLCCFIFA